jgi:hypothetical protein
MGDRLLPAAILTPDLLEQAGRHLLCRDGPVTSRVEPLNLGTSGARLFVVTLSAVGCPDKDLILKITRHDRTIEAKFYRDLSADIPMAVPPIAAGIKEEYGWILMECVQYRDHMTWTAEDYLVVVDHMAAFHASHWGRVEPIGRDWMTPTDAEALRSRSREWLANVDTIADSWLLDAAPSVFHPDRLKRIRSALGHIEVIVQPMRDAGLTLVHGDYWFYNVLLADDGRVLMVDWQDPTIWSGLWELAYFINLLGPMGDAGYRDLPVPDDAIVTRYRSSLRRAGVDVEDVLFDGALTSARVFQPLMHWLPQLASAAEYPDFVNNPLFEPSVRFQARTFDDWDIALARLC